MTTPELNAAQRLMLSRERMRDALQGTHHRTDGATGSGASPDVSWLMSLKDLPGVAVVVELVGLWWARHPWRPATEVGAQAANTALHVVAQRHPIALVAGAVALGGVLAWARPWRWVARAVVVSNLLPQLMAGLVARAAAQTQEKPPATPPQENAGPVAGGVSPSPAAGPPSGL